MIDMPKRIRNLWIAIGIWALVIASTLVFYFELWNALYFFTGYWIIGCEITGLIITGVTLIVLIKERPGLPIILALISIVGLFFLLIKGPDGHWGVLPRFYLSKLSYQATVAKLRSARDEAERQAICAGRCEFELGTGGTVSRVVFPWTYDDVMLGWIGVVYDPEGKVATTRAREGSFFGCTFFGAEQLSEDWYLCSFWHR
jgi:peptidoglycan/LPS O-acetylase OafA/YrhL